MSANLQPIPLGLTAIHPYLAILVVSDGDLEPGDNTYQNDAFVNPPSVFIDGILITYNVVSDRRYISYDATTKTITFNNAPLNNGEIVEIFL